MKLRFLLWLIGWGNLIDGIVKIPSLSFIRTSCALKLSKYYSITKCRMESK